MTEGLGIPAKELAYTAKRLADAGLALTKREGISNCYAKLGDAAALEKATGTATRKQAKTSGKKAKQGEAADEIELVMNGVMIVIGRNPETNRMRITLNT